MQCSQCNGWLVVRLGLRVMISGRWYIYSWKIQGRKLWNLSGVSACWSGGDDHWHRRFSGGRRTGGRVRLMSCALSLEDLEEVYFGLCQGRHYFLWLLLRRRWCLGMTLWTFTSQPIAGSKLRCLTDTCFNQSQSGNGGGIKVKFPQNIIFILIFRRFYP